MPPLAAKTVLKTFAVFDVVPVSPGTIEAAIDCSVLNTLSFRDALIIASAASAGCARILTDDLNAGQAVLGVAIENPLGRLQAPAAGHLALPPVELSPQRAL